MGTYKEKNGKSGDFDIYFHCSSAVVSYWMVYL